MVTKYVKFYLIFRAIPSTDAIDFHLDHFFLSYMFCFSFSFLAYFSFLVD